MQLSKSKVESLSYTSKFFKNHKAFIKRYDSKINLANLNTFYPITKLFNIFLPIFCAHNPQISLREI